MYMTFYRARFPEVRIIPKQHVLEAHCVQWIRRWGFGLALHGEQGGEEIHATVNRIQRRAWGMRNYEDRLRLLMKEQLTQASPVLQATPPPPYPLPPKKKKTPPRQTSIQLQTCVQNNDVIAPLAIY